MTAHTDAAAATILIVDDEPFFAELLRRRLDADGYRVVLARSGERAIEATERHRPEVVLLDVRMPGMSGLEVCRALREKSETVDVQVIMVTALEGEEHMVAALEAGADDFIGKSVSETELRARVAAHVRSRRRLDAIRALEAKRDRLVHMLVHDIRSPLTAVILNAHFLQDADPDELGETVREIRESGERMKSMVDTLLLTAKSTAGELEPHLVDTDLEELIARVVRVIQPMAHDRSVRLSTRIDGVGALRVDSDLVQRALENLTSNAVKVSLGGDVVSIEVAEVDDMITIAVSDQGAGIPASQREEIFAPFKGTGRASESIGLGLQLVRSVALVHDGDIQVQDAPEGGARFVLSLPRSGTGARDGFAA